jgi:hypothetical protein
MKIINQSDFTTALAVLFRETFEGMPKVEENVYLAHDSGMFITLGKIDAERASTEINATTIAAHSEHTRFYLELLDNYLNKNMRVVNFSRSWDIKIVSEDEWDDLRENISRIYRKTTETFNQNEEWSLDEITVAMGIIAHTAYHLGAIRQMLKGF